MFFQKLFGRVLPSVKADDDEDLVDPQQVLRVRLSETSMTSYSRIILLHF